MKKFYGTTLARKPLTFSGHVITFLISSISGGRAFGVYATENPEEIQVLDAAVAGRRGVSSISEEDYDLGAKKATPTRSSKPTDASQPRLVRPQIQPELAMGAKVGVSAAAIAEPTPAKTDQFQGETHTTPSIASLLKVKRLNPPKPFATSETKTKKASDRADRAKVRMVRAAVNTP